MRREDTVLLNVHALARQIESAGWKHWWVAERVGVDRKTISRWLSGKTRRIARSNVQRLATLLQCAPEQLYVCDEADVSATRTMQRAAARMLQEQDLLQLLSPSENWRLAESLIQATLEPDLPHRELGQLYNLLSVAAWRQGHYDVACERAERAQAIARRIGDRAIELKALHNLSVVESLVGRIDRAIEGFRVCTVEPHVFDSRRALGSALSNLGVLYASALRFEESVATLGEAIRIFEELGADYNLSIAFTGLGAAHTERGAFEAGREAFERGGSLAGRCGYTRGVDCAPLYVADAMSLAGERESAALAVRRGVSALGRYSVYDIHCHEAAARVLRRAGDLQGARAQLEVGLQRAERFHEHRGRLLHEQSRLATAQSDPSAECVARCAGNAAFRLAGLEMRMSTAPLCEYGL